MRMCDSWVLSASCYRDLNKGGGRRAQPEDLEIDGTRNAEGEGDSESSS